MLLELAAGAGGMYEFGDSNAPDIVVCTPRYLSNQIKGPVISDKCLFESIRHVVLDEVSIFASILCFAASQGSSSAG